MPVQKLPRPLTNKIQLSLHIRHPSLQPEEISKEMRWLPVDSFAVGEPCQASIGSGTELAPRLHTESYWVATLDAAFLSRHSVTRSRTASRRSVQISDETLRILASSESTESFITLACSSLLRHASSAKLIVTMVEPTLRIPPEVSRRLADLGITLEAEFVSR
jgi:hypothetical protein